MRTRLTRFLMTAVVGIAVSSCSTAQVGPDSLSSDIDLLLNSLEADSATLQKHLRTATVKSSVLKLRSKPRLRTKELMRMEGGDTLEVLKIRKDGWVKLRTPDGIIGWAWGPLLDIEGRKWITARYKGMTHILYSRSWFMGPDGVKRSRLAMRGLHLRKPLRTARLTSPYGIRKKHPVNGGNNVMHQGVDMAARTGTSVYTAASGTVKSIKRGKNYGLYVDIQHKLGFTTRYAHLSRILVKKGQRVRTGKLIAKSGNTGATTGPHLHFELKRLGKSVNPRRYVSGI